MGWFERFAMFRKLRSCAFSINLFIVRLVKLKIVGAWGFCALGLFLPCGRDKYAYSWVVQKARSALAAILKK